MQALKALVIILGILILIAFGFLAYGVATKFGGSKPTVAVERNFAENRITLPAGARVVETTFGGGRIILRMVKPDGAEALVLIDAATGVRAGLVHLDRETPQ